MTADTGRRRLTSLCSSPSDCWRGGSRRRFRLRADAAAIRRRRARRDRARYDAAETITGTAIVTVTNDSESRLRRWSTLPLSRTRRGPPSRVRTGPTRWGRMGPSSGRSARTSRCPRTDRGTVARTAPPPGSRGVRHCDAPGNCGGHGESSVLDLEPTNESIDAPNTTGRSILRTPRHKMTTDDGTNRTDSPSRRRTSRTTQTVRPTG